MKAKKKMSVLSFKSKDLPFEKRKHLHVKELQGQE
jgi:hypothetical protein